MGDKSSVPYSSNLNFSVLCLNYPTKHTMKFVKIRSAVCRMFLLSRKNGVRSHVPLQDENPVKQSDTIQHVHEMTSHRIFIKMGTFCFRLVYLCSNGNIWMEIESDFQ